METAREPAGAASAAASPPTRRAVGGFVGLAPLLAACLWGGMYVVSRASFDAIPPITLGLLRVIIGGLTLWLALRLTARRQPATARSGTGTVAGDQWRFLLLGGTLAATIITQFWG